MLSRICQGRVVRFLIGGGLAAALNVLLIYLLIDRAGMESPLQRNAANAISMEISLLFSFCLYRTFVWTGGSWKLSDVFRQLLLYHVAAGAAILTRMFLVFPALDFLGVHYVVNTLVGVGISATVNYVLSDQFVFSSRGSVVAPEGLEPATAVASHFDRHRTDEPATHVKTMSIVIPAYNEEGSIAQTVAEIVARLRQEDVEHEVLVVNDNSTDQTEQVLRELSARFPSVRYVNNHYPNGFGFAVRCGLEKFSGDAVAIVMGDASDSPDDIVAYYRKLNEGYDCVFGSRFMAGSRVIDYPQVKLFVNRCANLFIQLAMGIRFNDTTNAFKAYRREVIEGVSPLISHHFNLTVEIPLKAIARGFTYAQIPISWQNRKTGISKLKLNEMGSRYLFIVLSILLEKRLSKGDYVAKRTRGRSVNPQRRDPELAVASGGLIAAPPADFPSQRSPGADDA